MILRFLNPYLLNIIMLLFWAVVLLIKRNSQESKKVYVLLATINWIVLSGLRHVSIGADTLNYYNLFKQTLETSWITILNNFFEVYFRESNSKDPGYYFLVKIIQLFTDNYQVFLILVALAFTVPLGMWIYKNSKNPFVTFLIYSVLFYAFFSITGTRQTIATSLVVLVGYEYIKERRLLPFILLTFIGFTIHKSALVFFPFYFLANKKITKRYLVSTIALFPVIMYFRVPISLFFQEISGYEYGIYEGAGTRNFTILIILVALVGIWKSDIILVKNSQATHYYNALVISILATPLTWVNPSAMRVVQYYSIYLLLLIPEIINSFNNEEKPVVYYTVVSLLLLLLIRSNPQYMFFWQ